MEESRLVVYVMDNLGRKHDDACSTRLCVPCNVFSVLKGFQFRSIIVKLSYFYDVLRLKLKCLIKW